MMQLNLSFEQQCSKLQKHHLTVKFLNFQTPKIFAVSYLEFEQRGENLYLVCQNRAKGIANSEDHDQTAPLGAV